MPEYPSQVRAGAAPLPAFERRAEYYSVRRRDQARTAGAVAVVRDDDTTFSIHRGQPPAGADAEDVGPVYSAGPGGPLAVPTGRVFVRLAEGVRPAQLHQRFEAAGFEIERTLSYAPHAAWLRPREGGVARALPGLAALESIPDVIHVEPQMLLERALK